MGKFLIRGGAPLYGRVRVSGSKNAALAVIFASLVTDGVSEIRNLPDIGDVRVALDILRCFGARISRIGDTTYIDTRRLKAVLVPSELTSRLRASTYLLGACLVRFGRADEIVLGGCNFSDRPIDIHIAAMLSHGARVKGGGIVGEELLPSDFTLLLPSVGASVNSLILASGIKGRSVVRGIALEPHILTLIDFLCSAGAKIELSGNTATVDGTDLRGGRVTVGSDMIEAGTYLAVGVLTGGRVTVERAVSEELLPFTNLLSSAGVSVTVDDGICAYGRPSRPINVIAEPYPAFPTDLQPIIAPLLSFSGGKIRDNVWPTRLGYLEALKSFGIRSRLVDGTAEIFPSEPSCGNSDAPDLRGGMALVMAALAADGVSVIGNAEIVMRGYERITEKLSHLGAEITYIP
jgi:UDP-N-acetylglucosamine 1-carboxyvinyltransferase